MRLYLELHQTVIPTSRGDGLEKSAPDATLLLLVSWIYSDAPEHHEIIAVFEHEDARGEGRYGCGADKRSWDLRNIDCRHRGVSRYLRYFWTGASEKISERICGKLSHVDHGSG